MTFAIALEEIDYEFQVEANLLLRIKATDPKEAETKLLAFLAVAEHRTCQDPQVQNATYHWAPGEPRL